MWKIVLLVLAAAYVADSEEMRVGGFNDVDVNDVGLQNALDFAVVQHNRESNAVCPGQVSRVLKAQRQLVAGYKYVITTEMARAACRGTSANAPYQCKFTVWSRPWLNDIKVLESKC